MVPGLTCFTKATSMREILYGISSICHLDVGFQNLIIDINGIDIGRPDLNDVA